VMAANDGQSRDNELLRTAPQNRTTWPHDVNKEERFPESLNILNGASQQHMTPATEAADN
ncbi:hypothetical protein VSS95_29230, partial [Pseudomonas syringae pv. tagetis]